jgi:hypothetical protein
VVNFVPKNAPHSVFVHCQCSTPSSVLCIRDVLGQVRTNHRYTGYTSLPYAPNEADYLQSRKTTFTKYNRATHKNTSQDTTYCINTDGEPSNAVLSPASEFPPAIKFVKAKFARPPLIAFLSICLMCGVNLHWKTPKLPLIKTLQVRKKWRNVSLKKKDWSRMTQSPQDPRCSFTSATCVGSHNYCQSGVHSVWKRTPILYSVTR